MFNKRVLISLLFIGMVATMAGAGTWAAIGDKAASEGNTITTGEVDLIVAGGDRIVDNGEGYTYVSVPTLVTMGNLKPGWSETRESTIKIKNAINANDAYISLYYKGIKGAEDYPKTEPEWSCEAELGLSEADAHAVDKMILCTVSVSTDGGETYVPVEGPTLLSELKNKKIDLGKGGELGVAGAFEPGKTINVKQEFSMLKGKEMADYPELLGIYLNDESDKYCQNWAQGDYCEFSEVFKAKQTADPNSEGCGDHDDGCDGDHEDGDDFTEVTVE